LASIPSVTIETALATAREGRNESMTIDSPNHVISRVGHEQIPISIDTNPSRRMQMCSGRPVTVSRIPRLAQSCDDRQVSIG
jgi:hypothetical protein